MIMLLINVKCFVIARSAATKQSIYKGIELRGNNDFKNCKKNNPINIFNYSIMHNCSLQKGKSS